MMANDLDIPQLAENQSRPDVTTNDATAALAEALSLKFDCDLSAGNVSISSADFRRAVIFYATGVATSGRTLTVPQNEREFFLVECDATNTNTISLIRGARPSCCLRAACTCAARTGPRTASWPRTSAAPDVPNDFAIYVSGVLSNSQTLIRIKATRAFTLPTNLVGSYVNVGVAATASTTITFKKNGSSIGTSVIGISGTDGSHTVTQTSFAVGDLLTIHGPASADATAADWAIGIKASR
jgi:hypothetical protein